MFTSSDFPDLAYLGKLIHESLQLPVFCKSNVDPQEEYIWSDSLSPSPSHSDPAELFRLAASQGTVLNGPAIHESNYLEQFAVVPVRRKDQCQAIIVIGPVTRQKPNGEIFTKLLNDYGIPIQERTKWMEYWHNLPIMNRLRLLHICVSANLMINQEALEITDVLQTSLQYGLSNQLKESELALADLREYSVFHEGISGAQQMLALIRSGDKTELMKMLAKTTNSDDQIGVLSKRSHLRSVKNLAICGIALSSNAALEGGLNEELAITLSDLHIQHIEELNELALVEAAVIRAIVDFADRVGQSRKNSSTKPVQVSKEYIYLHLFEEMTLQQLSNVSGLNPNYLSQLFKKETGLTLMNYIQRERVEEAKKLLDHSGDTISRIGARLTFYDQTHFIKVFKKHAGVTPKKYRDRNHSS
ncbi:helix-turn-helix domain-containing protein [Paenibacillus sp. LHD-38]|uniref:helix-turn-helix domain-containing protein n=1 Tax=Paenibacillus sp. LHD-38 TaxID=3072143 RepID=UPI00280D851B|nr:helix-turn-helix domain-containing protein [Paenibacillus sp. LHD-38]MDQ8734529.1 helix-turn-helix domain-containing protein [Paenibacillus sp. LHD-38]